MTESQQQRAPSTGLTFLVLFAAAVALLIAVVLLAAGDKNAAQGTSTDPTAAAPEETGAPAAVVTSQAIEPEPGVQLPRRFWRPGQEHDYGSDEDPFIRQPHDYGTDTPRILGNRISHHVFDLERVQDMVRRGSEANSEIARARGGSPLTDDERQQARAALQKFFDQTVPDVDRLVGGELSRDQGYARIAPRRQQLDRDLRAALKLTKKQFYQVWPHIAQLDRNRGSLTDGS